MSTNYIQEVKENQEHFDKVLFVLENTYNEINTTGGNGRIARIAKDVYNALDAFTKIVNALDDYQNKQ